MRRSPSALGLLALSTFVAGAALAAEAPSRGEPSRAKPPVPQSAVGPTSPAEAEMLIADAQARLARGDHEGAILPLERYIARYPGAASYIEAHRLLGLARLEAGHPADALAPLRYYVGAARPPASSSEARDKHDGARLLLATAQLALGRHSEASLIAGEVLASRKLPAATEVRALLLQARARLGLGQTQRASFSIRSARQALARVTDGDRIELEPWLNSAELQLRLRECARFATGTLDEAQALDQFERRGQCLEEALLAARPAFSTMIRPASVVAADALGEAFSAYFRRAEDPPPPPAAKSKPRTQAQLSTYRRELSERLRERARARASSAATTIRVWVSGSAGTPPPEPGRAALLALLPRIERLAGVAHVAPVATPSPSLTPDETPSPAASPSRTPAPL